MNLNSDGMVVDIKAPIQTCSSSMNHALAVIIGDCEVHNIKASSQTRVNIPDRVCEVHDIKASSQTCPTNNGRHCMVHDIKASIQT